MDNLDQFSEDELEALLSAKKQRRGMLSEAENPTIMGWLDETRERRRQMWDAENAKARAERQARLKPNPLAGVDSEQALRHMWQVLSGEAGPTRVPEAMGYPDHPAARPGWRSFLRGMLPAEPPPAPAPTGRIPGMPSPYRG